MNRLVSSYLLGSNKVLRDFHFWVIIVLIVAIAVIYYQWREWFPWFWHYFIIEFKNHIIGIPFIIPFVYSVAVFGWCGAIACWLISASIMLPLLFHYLRQFEPLVFNAGFSLVPLLIVAIVVLELRWREQQRSLMAEREDERKAYLSQVIRAQEEERHRISRELHDDTTQQLLVIANRVQSLLLWKLNSKQFEEIKYLRDDLLSVSEGVHRISIDLRPAILDDVGLVPALRWLADKVTQSSKVNIKVAVKGEYKRLNEDVETALFRVSQEALSNVLRHSRATKAKITLEFNKLLKITIQDNGKGFSLTEAGKRDGKLGMADMRQRISLIGGSLYIESQHEAGTLITIHVPIPE